MFLCRSAVFALLIAPASAQDITHVGREFVERYQNCVFEMTLKRYGYGPTSEAIDQAFGDCASEERELVAALLKVSPAGEAMFVTEVGGLKLRLRRSMMHVLGE